MGHGTKTATAETPPELRDNLCWLLSQATHAFTEQMTRGLEATGVSPRAHMVLCAATTGELTQIELARTVGLDKTTMVVTLDELEAKGLAERRPSPTDRRARVIAVTAAGKRLIRRAEEIGQRIREETLELIPEEDRDAFLSSLCRIATRSD